MSSCQLWGWRDGLGAPVILTSGTRTRLVHHARTARAEGWYCTVYETGGVPDALALVGIHPGRLKTTVVLVERNQTT